MAWLSGLLVSTFFGLFFAGKAVVRRVGADGQIRAGTGRRVKNALFIHSGVMRNYQKMWPLWEKNFINPSKKAGVEFTIAVTTDLRSWCHPDADRAYSSDNYKFPTENGCACMRIGGEACDSFARSVTPESKASFKRELQQTYGKASKDGIIHVEDMAAEDLPNKHFNSVYTRARPVLKKYENQTFDYIIVARPDIVLANSHNFSFDVDEFNLVSMCTQHPGMNLISGSFIRPKDEMHHRDWDWGYVLCDGAHADNAKSVLFGNSGWCDERIRAARKAGTKCVPAPRSAEFVGTGNWTCTSRACGWFEGMQGKMRFGNLDDTLFGLWPNMSHRGYNAHPYKPPQ